MIKPPILLLSRTVAIFLLSFGFAWLFPSSSILGDANQIHSGIENSTFESLLDGFDQVDDLDSHVAFTSNYHICSRASEYVAESSIDRLNLLLQKNYRNRSPPQYFMVLPRRTEQKFV